MFYILNEREPKLIELEDLSPEDISVGYLTIEELENNYDKLGLYENIIHDCMADQTHFRTSVDIYDDFSFGIINIVNVMNVQEAKDRVAFILKKNQFILVKLMDEDESCRDMFENSVMRYKQNATMEKIIYGILESLLQNGNKSLESTELKIIIMEQELVNGRINQYFDRDIFNLRKELSLLKTYYEQLFDIGDKLQENENDLFDRDVLRYFKLFTAKAERLSNGTQSLCDSLVHLRESLEACTNYNLNNIMKIFTVVTTIFLPLTLIVGWYGMNFTNMPELTWKYGYLSVILLSLLVVIGCLTLFKKKKLF
ncbi:CorA family divalent cation transporter [Clostridium aminobutyricum]|uniref:Magnesium transport protein CorA n=1 Tax=Clostridium aminobutyricum TaxID=33953 RepID=A0A939D5U6_CLOAM|nr:CorA family divalent cation transporter [Clostridium aminobutyricum]MBN7771799.1 hypothetical protein [Clostridium aminobutyricum]